MVQTASHPMPQQASCLHLISAKLSSLSAVLRWLSTFVHGLLCRLQWQHATFWISGYYSVTQSWDQTVACCHLALDIAPCRKVLRPQVWVLEVALLSVQIQCVLHYCAVAANLVFGPDYQHHQGTSFGFHVEGFGAV